MRGKRTTSILLVLGALALLISGVSASAARSPSPRVELGHVNTISGDHITGMPVRIPRDATIEADPFENANVSYRGPGRVVGIVLVEEDDPLGKASQLVAVRWDFCGKPGCSSRDRTPLTSATSWGGKRYRIPAGDYMLYLIADGAPVRVELRLDGLTGTTSLRPTASVAGRIAAPEAELNPTGHLFLGHARPMVMPDPGLLIDSETTGFSHLGPRYGARGSCFWRSRFDEQPPEQTVPGPHCIRYSERAGWSYGGSPLGGGSAGWGIGNVPAGKWRSSYWSAEATVTPETEFLTLWLAYEGRV